MAEAPTKLHFSLEPNRQNEQYGIAGRLHETVRNQEQRSR